MLAEWLIHRIGWTDSWYAHPGPHLARSLLTWGENGRRWHVGYWTGPDHDLICVRHEDTKAGAEEALSPGGYTLLHATLLSAGKLLLLAGRRRPVSDEAASFRESVARWRKRVDVLNLVCQEWAEEIAGARAALRKAIDRDDGGSLEELVGLLVFDRDAEHERAERAEEKLAEIAASVAAKGRLVGSEYEKLAKAVEEYLDVAAPGVRGYMPDILSTLTAAAKLRSAKDPS